MFSENKICNTCEYKSGKVFTAPISKKKVPVYSCSSVQLAEGYCYEENSCKNYKNGGKE